MEWQLMIHDSLKHRSDIAALIVPVALLAACGGSEAPSVVGPPAVAPPPFQSEAVVVQLGQFGGKVTLMSKQDGGFTLDGKDFTGGEIIGGNGMTYALSLAGDNWSVVHVPATVPVELGSSGATLALASGEDGSFAVASSSGVSIIRVSPDGAPLGAQAANGNEYALSLADGVWQASFIPPPPLNVVLGRSGESLLVQRIEDGGYLASGVAVVESSIFAASNGNKYALSMQNGSWVAEYSPTTEDVQLGLTGEIATLSRAEDGSYWFDREEVHQGRVVEASNGNRYSLSLEDDGIWMAMFVPMPRMTVPLGTSGASVLVDRQEDGRLTISGLWMSSGPVSGSDALGAEVTASNGNAYYLSEVDGRVIATFVPSPPAVVRLGTSGETVEIALGEDGRYRQADRVVIAGEVVTSSAGKNYTLMFMDGIWRARFAGEQIQVKLGDHGGLLTVRTAEDGSYRIGSMKLATGDTVTGALGNRYTLSLGDDGDWTSAFQSPEPVSVVLGRSGSILLQRAEDGSWSHEDDPVVTGSTVDATNGLSYQLSLTGGKWSAAYQAAEVPIRGTKLTAVELEDGSGFDVAGTLLPSSGIGEIAVAEASYRIWSESGRLMGARYQSEAWDEATAQYVGDVAELSFVVDNDDTPQNEERTGVTIDGDTYSFAELLEGRVSTVIGANFLEEASDSIQRTRKKIRALHVAFPDGGDSFDTAIERLWDEVQSALDTAFGSDEVRLASDAPIKDGVLEQVDRVLAALSTPEGFAASAADDGVFSGLLENIDLTAQQVFNAVRSEASLSFGVTGTSNYGALSKKERANALAKLEYAPLVDEDEAMQLGAVGAFAFSASPETARSRFVQVAGTAYYEGETKAVSGDGLHYAGDMAVRVRFSTGNVTGLVLNLATADGKPWTHLLAETDSIRLPAAKLGPSGSWSAGGLATVRFPLRGSTLRPLLVASSFAGELVGGREASAGHEVVGTWSVGSKSALGDYLTGGFAAERAEDRPEPRPAVDDGGGKESEVIARPEVGETRRTSIRQGLLEIIADQYGWGLDSTAGIGLDDEAIQFSDYRPVPDDPSTLDEVESKRLYQIGLRKIFSDQGSVHTTDGAKWAGLASAKIEEIRLKLAALLHSDQLPRVQARLWRDFQNVVGTMLFEAGQIGESEIAEPYDPRRGEEALQLIDDTLAALATPEALDDALDRDGGGVFTHNAGPMAGQPFAFRAPGEIWNERESQVKTLLRATDYTRFGLWSVRVTRNALRSDPDHDATGSAPWIFTASEAFAYSPLLVTTYLDEDDEAFPSDTRAIYVGATLAWASDGSDRSIEPLVLSGDAVIIVNWNQLGSGADSPAGTLTAVITGLADATGDRPGTASGGPIEELVFPGVAVTYRQGPGLRFSSRDVTVRAAHANPFRPSGLVGGTATIRGHFVGLTHDGPLSVLGRWTLEHSAVEHGGGRTRLEGAFGADLP